MITVVNANALQIPLPDQSVQCIITSPPYWGLRDYGTATWKGGSAECDHIPDVNPRSDRPRNGLTGGLDYMVSKDPVYKDICAKCGARRIDAQIGLEPTPADYVANIVRVMREVWRVLRDDGVLWINLGDSYFGDSPTRKSGAENFSTEWDKSQTRSRGGLRRSAASVENLKPKDLCGIPWRVAFALQQPYVVPTCVKDERDRAWLAAIFDGEGCIGIRRFESYRKELEQQYQDGFVIYTTIGNNDVELLDRCVEITGFGSVRIKQRAGDVDSRGIKSRRDNWGWRLDGNKAVDIIRAVYPYLIAKRQQACIAYTLDSLNKNGHGSRAVPKEIQDKKEYLKDLIHRCNQREDIDLPSWIEEPKQEVQPGWYLRSDIIWSKPNPMPESVTDRPTKSHEYVFLLTKRARYYYDNISIQEPVKPESIEREKYGWNQAFLGRHQGSPIEKRPFSDDHDGFSNPSGRNRRTVWTVATSPYSGAKETADYVGDDGKPYRASPNCPIHGHLARDRKSYTVGYDEPLDQNQIRNAGNGNDHEQAPVSLQSAMIYRSESDVLDENVQPRSLESIDDYRSEAHRLESILPAQTVDRTNRTSEYDAPSDRTSGLTRREYDPSATDHSKQKSKTARARRKAQRDNASSEIHGHTQSMLPIDEHIDLDDRTDENNSGEDYALGEMQIDLSVQKISRIARIDSSFDTSHMRLYCTCEVVSTDHFATFPPALVEPMILAGTSQRGACPTCGSGWVRVVEKSGERIVRYSATNNGPYRERNTVDELYTVGWQPACACYAVPPLPDEPDDKSNGHYAAYLAERARLLELYAALPTVPCRVLDPFAGTATVGRVCAKHGRDFIGTELNPKYITLADERTSKIQITMPL